MIVYLNGTDSFLAREAINKLKAKYREKNPDGTELIEIDCTEPLPNFADLQAVPLFATSRLAVIKEAGLLAIKDQDDLASYLTDLPTTTIVVLWDSKPFAAKGKLLSIANQASKKISVEPLSGTALRRWLSGYAKESGIELGNEQVAELINRFGSNLFAHSTELATLALSNQSTSSWAIETATEPFILYRLLMANNIEALRAMIKDMAAKDEPAELVIGMLAAATRKMPNNKRRLKLTEILADLDFALKTGLLDNESALALLVANLAQRATTRLQWSEAWLEIN